MLKFCQKRQLESRRFQKKSRNRERGLERYTFRGGNIERNLADFDLLKKIWVILIVF